MKKRRRTGEWDAPRRHPPGIPSRGCSGSLVGGAVPAVCQRGETFSPFLLSHVSQSVRIGVCRIRYTDPGLRVWVQAAGTVCDRKGEGGFVGQGFRGWMVFCVWDGLLVTLSGMTL